MSKRRGHEPSLPLFDLPLREPATGSGTRTPVDPTLDDESSADEPTKGRSPAGPPPVMPVPPPLDLAPFDPPAKSSAPVAKPSSARAGTPASSAANDLLFDPFEVEPEPTLEPPASSPETVDEPPLLFTDDDLLPVGEHRDATDAADSAELDDTALIQDRLLGGLADLVLHLVVVGSMVLAVRVMGVAVGLEAWPPFTVFALLFSLLYTVIPLAFWGQTPGMAWVGHVARTDLDEPLTFGQTLGRWVGSVVTVALAGLPLLLTLGGRSLADRLSQSVTRQG